MPSPTFERLPESKRQRFVHEALVEFAEYGYEQASLSAIVARLGIAKGSVYQYFDDKADLYRYLLEQAVAVKAEFFAREPMDPHAGLRQSLRDTFAAGTRFQQAYPLFARLGERVARGDSPLPADLLQQGSSATLEAFESQVRAAQHRGEVSPLLDARTTAGLLLAVLSSDVAVAGGSVSGVGDLSSDEAVRRFDAVLDVLFSGLSPREGEWTEGASCE